MKQKRLRISPDFSSSPEVTTFSPEAASQIEQVERVEQRGCVCKPDSNSPALQTTSRRPPDSQTFESALLVLHSPELSCDDCSCCDSGSAPRPPLIFPPRFHPCPLGGHWPVELHSRKVR
ncbi:hypothetical protein N7462_010146 [Penicillium macrosclerotiorum]|uniref:uncharacterized protein n=1 Tax=Penicillium macrosclerotiorum TaxID=303699 RepID=UPI002546F34A|nr:uncharacterized protein N7462_010146 [Penicillium macrosclerotiorum]KAJ5669076.1 hypothetical protein N7462_010146 [Penicillium macrosclerotiorum]